MTNGREKSDPAIVALKPANAPDRLSWERSVMEPVEPRAGTEGNAGQGDTLRTPSRAGASHALDRVRKTATEKKKERLPRSLRSSQ